MLTPPPSSNAQEQGERAVDPYSEAAGLTVTQRTPLDLFTDQCSEMVWKIHNRSFGTRALAMLRVSSTTEPQEASEGLPLIHCWGYVFTV